VVETELGPAVTGRERLTRYEGGYSGTGRSENHAWRLNPAGEKMDCSEFPTERYKRRFVWEPSEPIPEVDYTELPADTASVLSKARERGSDLRINPTVTVPSPSIAARKRYSPGRTWSAKSGLSRASRSICFTSRRCLAAASDAALRRGR
jgi:hypothetical protein